jgi:hypothetical protein
LFRNVVIRSIRNTRVVNLVMRERTSARGKQFECQSPPARYCRLRTQFISVGLLSCHLLRLLPGLASR